MHDPDDKSKLRAYLDFAGIVACNVNPYLPSLSDIGCGWQELAALIDSRELFFCKAYRKRSVYLSREVYFLLKRCRTQKAMDQDARILNEHMERLGPSEINMIRLAIPERKRFDRCFDFLLQNLYVTAYQNGKYINANWSSLIYSVAKIWEENTAEVRIEGDPLEKLRCILLRTMPEKEFLKLIG